MITSRLNVMDDLLEMLNQLAHDWEYSSSITSATLLFDDLGFESLDVVVLGTAIQEKYGVLMPFAEFLIDVGQRELRDISVGELVEFVQQHIDAAVAEGLV